MVKHFLNRFYERLFTLTKLICFDGRLDVTLKILQSCDLILQRLSPLTIDCVNNNYCVMEITDKNLKKSEYIFLRGRGAYLACFMIEKVF